MKHLMTIFMSLLCLCAYADDTHDYVTLSTAELTPGGSEIEVVASLNRVDNNTYTGFQMDIVIPEPFDFVKVENEDEDLVCCLKLTGSGNVLKAAHLVEGNIIDVNGDKTLRVTCITTSGAEFKTGTGGLFKFSLKANSFAKPGVADIQIKNTKFGNGTTQYLVVNKQISSISVSSSSSLPLSVSSETHWSTCILPFDASIPAGVKAYASDSHDSENVYLTEVQTLKAYTPYVLYSENGYSGTMSGTVDANSYPASGYVAVGNLNGAIVNQEISSGYVLQKHDSGFMFYRINPEKAVTVPAGKCWVTLSDAGASIRNIVITDANGIQSALSDDDSSEVFNLMGIRVQQPKSGAIYIKNGKKFINK